ncbi:AhpC/TSA family protein [Pedobacter boryungensis]|uniref:AhpC/TSA family protein n=2 Tax=Pedobacter boryungensis TaxID=869962 RepID=A0ABX2DES7_9SPHI|nr:AhpC/TSA family protein [Pedobacter boryungensis]
MKNLCTLFYLVFTLFLTASAQKFNIHGTVTGLNDGTWIFLRKANPELKLDSSRVLNGKFNLKGNIEEKAVEMIIYTANYKDYTMLWIEPKEITVTVKAGEFKNAITTGSKTQIEADILRKKLITINYLEDSLTKLLKGKNGPETTAIWDKIKASRIEEQKIYQTYVKDNPNSLIAANVLQIYASSWGKEKTRELYQNISAEQKSSKFGKAVNEYLALNKEIKIGNKFEDFEQENINGKKVKLSSIKGKYILLEFWASWCGPCRGENPNLVTTYNAYKNKGFEVLGVSADDNKADWLKAVKDDKLPWENVSDLKGDRNLAVVIYGINAFPTNYLIDDKGIIIAKNLRGDDLKKKLAELLP